MTMKVLITDGLAKEGLQILTDPGLLKIDNLSGLTKEKLLEIIPEYQALIVRSATKVDPAVIEKARELKVIGRAGTGVDNIDLDAATKRGILVMNSPGGNMITTAELSIAMLLSLARSIPQATASMREGKWDKKSFLGTEVRGKTLGVIGVGRIGGAVAEMAQGMGMRVIANDPYLTPEVARKKKVESVDLPTLYKNSHFITIHTPVTDSTKGLVGREAFAQMRDGIYIINCARGEIMDEEALQEALNSGKVAGAALDVFHVEPLPADHPFRKNPKIIITPHLGASTAEAQTKVSVDIAQQVADYLIRGIIRGAVNLPSVSADVLEQLRPYLLLSERLGKLLSQLYRGQVSEISLEYRGEVANFQTEPLTIAAIKGVLDPILEEKVNYVNAPVIAEERGIKISESRSPSPGDYSSMIILKVKVGDVFHQASGALFGKNDPRIVRINGFSLEAVPEGHILVLENRDEPGVIGNIGTLLGQRQVNIARMQLGREEAKGKAIALLHLDQKVSEEILGQLRRLPNIINAIAVEL